jgi:NAD-dependent DNA ligase
MIDDNKLNAMLGKFVGDFGAALHAATVFVGEKLSPRSRYTMYELVRRIEEHGGRVDKTVTIDTDFMIAIEKAEESDEFQKGVQFGVIVMREPELLEYLGR